MKRKYFILVIYFAAIAVSTNAQVIKFAMEEYNFGTINSGDTVICDFNFINSGDQALIISDVHGSCKCLVPSWVSTPINPNERGVITITFNSTGKMGMQDKTTVITSNDKNRIKVLHLKGNVSYNTQDKNSAAKTIKLTTGLPAISNTINTQTRQDSLKSFWGMPFGSSKDFVIRTMKEKGIVLKEVVAGNKVTLNTVADITFSNKTVFVLYLNFINNKFYEALLLYPTETPNIKDDFKKLVRNINEKYFDAEEYENYKYPYKKGDEHEESAISLGYGELNAFWIFKNDNAISLETLKVERNNYLKLTYQDSKLLKEAKAEGIKTSDY